MNETDGERVLPSSISIAELQPDIDQLPGRLGALHPIHYGLLTDAETVFDMAAPHGPTLDFSFIETIENPDLPEAYLEEVDIAASNELRDVETLIDQQIAAKDNESSVDRWQRTALDLLEYAAATSENKHVALVGALACSLKTQTPGERSQFLQEVYSRGLAASMASACAQSSIVYVETAVWRQDSETTFYPEIGLHRIASAAAMFDMDPHAVESYIQRVQGGSPEHVPATPKKIQKDMVDAIRIGTVTADMTTEAVSASLEGKKIDGVLLDPTKVERFALQQYFISQQKEAILGNDLNDTPLGRELVRLRAVLDNSADNLDPRAPMRKLARDVIAAFGHLSEPVVERFLLDQSTVPSRFEQKATVRFREVIKLTKQYYLLSQHIVGHEAASEALYDDPILSSIIRDGDPNNQEIWSVSQEGAALSNMAADVLINTVRAGLYGSVPEPIESQELLSLAHTRRRYLTGIAAHHLSEMPRSVESLGIDMLRDTMDRLFLTGEITVPAKGSFARYGAVALGCPALRETHEQSHELSAEQRMMLGYANYIDHSLAVIFNEANARGMFDLKQYRGMPVEDE